MITGVKVRDPIAYVEIDTNDWTPAFSKIEKNTTIQKVSGRLFTAFKLNTPDLTLPLCLLPLVASVMWYRERKYLSRKNTAMALRNENKLITALIQRGQAYVPRLVAIILAVDCPVN